MHEHISYFSKTSLYKLFSDAAYDILSIDKSKYGRMLYIASRKNITQIQVVHNSISTSSNYLEKCKQSIINSNKTISDLAQIKSLSKIAFFCPLRGINILPLGYDYTFVDDSPTYIGKYIPPFKSRIKSRLEVDWDNIDICYVLSSTFFECISESLKSSGYSSLILSLRDLIGV